MQCNNLSCDIRAIKWDIEDLDRFGRAKTRLDPTTLRQKQGLPDLGRYRLPTWPDPEDN
jgi:hypothetical protein